MDSGLIFKVNQNARKVMNNRLNRVYSVYKQLSYNASRVFAETFRDIARARLKVAISDSVNDISSLAEKINARQIGSVWVVTVDNRTGEQNIMAFLEYGTGLVGRENSHPLSSQIGWEYAINEENYVSMPSGDIGWFFDNKDYNYVPQSELLGEDGNKAFSSGIKPVRYIYDTRLALGAIINMSFVPQKGGGRIFNFNSFYTRLNKERAKWGLSPIILTT